MDDKTKREWTSESRRKQSEHSSRLWKGVPKTEEQKRKMSEAKIGVPKSDEHRKSMSLAHKQRWADIKSIQQEEDCTRQEALVIYHKRKEKDK